MKRVFILLSSVFVILVSLGCESKDDKSTKQEVEQSKEQLIVSDMVQAVEGTVASQGIKEVKGAADEVAEQLTEEAADLAVEQVADRTSPETEEQKVLQEEAVVKGSIFIRDQALLPENGMVTVVLEDISLADSPAEVVSEQTFSASGMHIPFDFELKFDPNKIKQTRQYNVRVRVEVEGQLRFTTDKIYPLIMDDDNTREINIELIGV